MRGELQRGALAAGIVLLIVFVAWAVLECDLRKSAVALGWFGMACLGLIGIGAAVLLTVGLL